MLVNITYVYTHVYTQAFCDPLPCDLSLTQAVCGVEANNVDLFDLFNLKHLIVRLVFLT